MYWLLSGREQFPLCGEGATALDGNGMNSIGIHLKSRAVCFLGVTRAMTKYLHDSLLYIIAHGIMFIFFTSDSGL